MDRGIMVQLFLFMNILLVSNASPVTEVDYDTNFNINIQFSQRVRPKTPTEPTPNQTTQVQSACPTIQTCPPVPTCPAVQTCPTCPTLEATTTQVISTTQVSVPAGFEIFHGRVILRPSTTISDPIGNYDDGMAFCDQHGAKPFIPRIPEDYQLYKEVRYALGYTIWLPANDRLQEGTLRWYNGEVATNISNWDWDEGQVMKFNREDKDCLWYGSSYRGSSNGAGIVYMSDCTHSSTAYKSYPPICEKM